MLLLTDNYVNLSNKTIFLNGDIKPSTNNLNVWVFTRQTFVRELPLVQQFILNWVSAEKVLDPILFRQ